VSANFYDPDLSIDQRIDGTADSFEDNKEVVVKKEHVIQVLRALARTARKLASSSAKHS
jgi:ribosomal protein L14